MSDSTNAPTPKSRPWGTIRQKGARYYVRFTSGGTQYERGPYSAWNTADKMLRRARALVEAGTPVAEILASVFGDFNGARLTFKDAAAHYLAYAAGRKRPSSLRDDRIRLGRLVDAPWARKMLGEIRPSDFLPWIQSRLGEQDAKRLRPRREGETCRAFLLAPDRYVPAKIPGASAPTVTKDLTLISALFRWAIAAGYVDDNPMRRVDRLPAKGRPERVYLTADEASALVAACPDVIRPIVLAAIHTGARRGELLGLRWRAVDLRTRTLRIEAGIEKAGRGRTVPLTSALASVLADLCARRPLPAMDGSDPVFLHADGTPLSATTLWQTFSSVAKGCEAIPVGKREGLDFHGLRHTAASIMVAAGVPILDVARILGHSTLAVTMRYAHFAPESGRSAIDKLGAALDPSDTRLRSAAEGSR